MSEYQATEREALSVEPESLGVGKLNSAVRLLRELLYQQKLETQNARAEIARLTSENERLTAQLEVTEEARQFERGEVTRTTARLEAAEGKAPWAPGRWFRVVGADGRLIVETSDGDEAQRVASEYDRPLERLWVRSEEEFREVETALAAEEANG